MAVLLPAKRFLSLCTRFVWVKENSSLKVFNATTVECISTQKYILPTFFFVSQNYYEGEFSQISQADKTHDCELHNLILTFITYMKFKKVTAVVIVKTEQEESRFI